MQGVNLLLDCPSAEDLTELFRKSPPRSPLPKWGDERWRKAFANPVMGRALKQVLARAAEEVDEALPELADELYADFAATGVRLRFERVYFERRRRFARAALALLHRDEPQWRKSFLNKLGEIFAEVSWALPAHVENATGKDKMRLDLFGAETANLLAECLVVFGDLIPVDFQERVLERLRAEFFLNYADNHIWWQDGTHNWNAVCHQGILGAALQVETDADLLARITGKVARQLPLFLQGYGPDGGSSEGPGYWEYGFGWFSMLNDQLEVRTHGMLSLFEGSEHVREIAKFGPRVCLEEGT